VHYDSAAGAAPAARKILVTGGFGAGKTSLITAVTEVQPVLTEQPLTPGAAESGRLAGLPAKTTTTVALDFGRITVSEQLVLYLFGVPGQDRFWFMWDELAQGALGAIVLADVRRLGDCFPAVSYFEQRQVPFLVAVNCFDGAPRYDLSAIRVALDLDEEVPLVLCDARDRASVKEILICLVESVYARLAVGSGRAAPEHPTFG
jgi:signal recognition particle receptor subunit beta